MMGIILLIAPLFVWIYEHDLRFNRHDCQYICKQPVMSGTDKIFG